MTCVISDWGREEPVPASLLLSKEAMSLRPASSSWTFVAVADSRGGLLEGPELWAGSMWLCQVRRTPQSNGASLPRPSVQTQPETRLSHDIKSLKHHVPCGTAAQQSLDHFIRKQQSCPLPWLGSQEAVLWSNDITALLPDSLLCRAAKVGGLPVHAAESSLTANSTLSMSGPTLA